MNVKIIVLSCMQKELIVEILAHVFVKIASIKPKSGWGGGGEFYPPVGFPLITQKR